MNYFNRWRSYGFIAIAALLLLFTIIIPANAGERAVIAPLAPHSLLLDIERIGMNLVAVGERGHVLLSQDSGANWEQIAVPTRATLTSVFFIDDKNGWAAGHDQVILRTRDGGWSWEQIYSDVAAECPLLDIFFLDADHGFAIGAYGQFLETFDGGNSWEGRWISPDDFHLNQMIAVGEQLFIAAEAGFAYRSDDGGKNWKRLNPDYLGSFFGIQVTRTDALLLFGLRGHLYRSASGGNNWVKIATGTTANLTGGAYLDDGTLVLVGLAGALLISHDEGKSFVLQQDPKRRGFSRVLQAADGAVVAVGNFGVARLSREIFK